MGRLKGVDEYSEATVTIPFPKGEESCWNCPLLDCTGRRMWCRRTGEIIVYEQSRPRRCPLVFKEEP